MSERIVPEKAKFLCKSKEVIQNKKDWCRGRARKYVGEGKYTYCAIGSLHETANSHKWGNHGHSLAISARIILDNCARELYPKTLEQGLSPIAYVNDYVGHEAVMKVFTHAIDKLIKEANPK